MSKVRGSKIAEFNYAGSNFAIIKMADASESEFVAPGSDQADAVLRLEAIADTLSCPPEYIEEHIDALMAREAGFAQELMERQDQLANAPMPTTALDDLIEAARIGHEVFGDDLVVVVGPRVEIEDVFGV